MNEILNEFYNINDVILKEYNESFIFDINGTRYYLYKLEDSNIDNIIELYNYVISNYSIRLHSIIYNKYNEIISDGYVLMVINILIDDIDYSDIKIFGLCNMSYFKDKYINVRDNWLYKLDYYEDKVNNMIIDDNIRYDYDYYNGIVEMLLKFINVEYEDIELYLCHKKRYNNVIDYYNPFNLSIDYKYRDIVYYDFNLLRDNFGYLSEYERRYIIFRILLPSDFFYFLEGLINGKELQYVSNIDDYEKLIINVQELFNYNIFKYIKRSN